MMIEVGEGYFRFMTQGETLEYSTTQDPFVASFDATYTIASPAVFTKLAHGLSGGDQVVLAITGALGNPNLPNLTLPVGLTYGPYTANVIDANTFMLTDLDGNPANVTGAPVAGSGLGVQFKYAIGDLTLFSGAVYYRTKIPPTGPMLDLELDVDPATDRGGYWYPLPSDPSGTIYELPNNYAAADVFDIHYVQSNDVMTLVHPGYQPSELRRLSATAWTFTPIAVGPILSPPANVEIEANPGYFAQIESITNDVQSLITTVSNHTLAMGDPVYLHGCVEIEGPSSVSRDGFYLVDKVPLDGEGNLIGDELYLMDLSGNQFHYSGTYTTGATLQFGSQIFNITNYYVVTVVASDSIQESAISSEVSVLNNLNVTGSYNTITWDAVPNAFRYYIYKKLNGLYGYIGETPAGVLMFQDNNIAPDFSITPPTYDVIFNGPDNYPGAVTYFQQRRAFAGTENQPENLWMTKTGTESDFSYSIPVNDTDRIAIQVASRTANTIRHLVPLNQLLLMTDQSEISVSPTNTDTITPSTIAARPQAYVGANNVQPQVVNNSLLYCANRGGHVRELGYQWQVSGYTTNDISLRAAHLFDNLEIVDQAFMKAPYQVMWFVSSNGMLLGLTYIPEEQIGAWHHHTTWGDFESVASAPEGVEDRLYAVINHTVNGTTMRWIGRMSTRNFDQLEDCFYVDAGATYDGSVQISGITLTVREVLGPAPLGGTCAISASAALFAYPDTTDVGSVLVLRGSDGNNYRFQILSVSSATAANSLPLDGFHALIFEFATITVWTWARSQFSGLDWLEGETVAILADGAVEPQQVVTGGTVTLEHPATLVTIGIPYGPAIETLPLSLQIDGMGQGRQKNINRVWVRVYRSSGILAGPLGGNLVEYKQRTTEPYGSPPNMITDEIEIVIPAGWQDSGQVYIAQDAPLPLTIVGLTIEAAIGG
jgi:hypothetical protein